MFRYLVRRVLYLIPILFGITLITFLLFHVVGGNPAAQAAGKYGNEAQIRALEIEMGLDKPLHLQYVDYLRQIVTFDFGRSWSTHQEISTMIMNGMGPSLSLTLPAFLLIIIISVSIALLLAHYRGGMLDKAVLIICLAGMSVSSLVYILYMQYWLAYKAGIFPISGWDPSWTGRWEYVALPILIFIILSIGGNVLFYRTVFLDEVLQDYVRTARAKGLGTVRILFKHVLRNALIPIITLVVLEMPLLILGSLLLESFFDIPGLGGLIYSAIQNSDFPVVKAMTFIGAGLYMIFQLISDLLYAVVDPKVQLR
ncbi:MAG: ABC transporter permease [Bdellovibrionota bacterium]